MPLRVNEKELANVCRSKTPGEIEGRLLFGPPEDYSEKKVQGFKERWFKLSGNLMFSFKLNEHGGVNKNAEPNGVLVVEDCLVQREGFEAVLFAFSITFAGGNSKYRRKYVFGCFSQEQAQKWVQHLRMASTQRLACRAVELEARIRLLGGKPNFEMSRITGTTNLIRAGSMPVLTMQNVPSPSTRHRPHESPHPPRQLDDLPKSKSKFYMKPPSLNISRPRERSLTPSGRRVSPTTGMSKSSFTSYFPSVPTPTPTPRERSKLKPSRPPPPVPPPPATKNLIEF